MNLTKIYIYDPEIRADVYDPANPNTYTARRHRIVTGTSTSGDPLRPYVVLEIGKSTWVNTSTSPSGYKYEDTWGNVLARVTPENIVDVSVTRRATSNGAYELGAVASSQVDVSLRYDESEGMLLPFSLNGLKVKVFFGYNQTESEEDYPYATLICMGKYIIDGTTVKRQNGSLTFTAYDLLSINILDYETIIEEETTYQTIKVQEEFGSIYRFFDYYPEQHSPYDMAQLVGIFLSLTDEVPLSHGLGIKEFFNEDTNILKQIYSDYSSQYSSVQKKAMNAWLQPSGSVKDLLTAIACCSSCIVMSNSEGELLYKIPTFEDVPPNADFYRLTTEDYYTFDFTSAYEESINSAYAEIEDTTTNQYLREWYEIEDGGTPVAYGGDYVGYDTQVDVRTSAEFAVLGKRIFSEGWSEDVDGNTHDPRPIQYRAFNLELNRRIYFEPLDRVSLTDVKEDEYFLTPFTITYRFGGGFRTTLSAERCGNILDSIVIDDALSATSSNLLESNTIAAIPSLPSSQRPLNDSEAEDYLEYMLGVTFE